MPEPASLGELIDLQIAAEGPMTVAAYMELCLSHPRLGYYVSGDPIGARGDFVTAPEISQMFGELIGFFIVNLWQQAGEPRSFTLLELGPGRGTLMQDALRAATRAEGFADALHLQLFESNATLRAQQASRLKPYAPYWAPAVDAVSDDPLFVVANEFFDALPINQVQKTDRGWHERRVGHVEGRRAFGLAPTPLPAATVPGEIAGAAPGAIYERSTGPQAIVGRLSGIIARQGGAILAIDYGYEGPAVGDTLQALRGHAHADPLESPGEIDLTAHVDFEPLGRAADAAGLSVEPLATQGDFLRRLGIETRAHALSRANPDQATMIAGALRRLTHADDMGDLFKVFCAHDPKLKPEGFA